MPDAAVPLKLDPNKEVFSEEEAALFLGVTLRSLRDWRWNNKDGPPFARYQRLIVYRRASLLRWVEQNESTPGRKKKARKS